MDIGTLRSYGLSKRSTTSDFPFDQDILVLRVMNKIFALIPLVANPPRVNLKCDPIWAEVLRQTYPSITAGYHMNKRHWNTVILDDSIPEEQILEMIDHAYDQVVKGLPKKDREALINGEN